MKPFAVLGGPDQTPAWCQEIADRRASCASAAAAAPRARRRSPKTRPYLWPTGPTPEQADAHLVEMVGKQLVGKPAEFAGDDAMQTRSACSAGSRPRPRPASTRSATTPSRSSSPNEYDGEIATRFTYLFDPAQAAGHRDHGRSPGMKDAGVTTVILSTDPLIPADITKEATAQNYFPEWVIGPNVLADTTIFGRTFDQEQWAHAFGLGARRRPGPSAS